ncbi:hypothetical protein Y1Q_0015427 [Alligator mississippiensis]|uniref:Uncharacterized protein n=1 Tax=Alligator mississippiensis TaxID=8496 RepID=A0A151NCV0_ALLMI|nr:hypothetical protein Y1Q_0015427 [Alligator mississippiensis]
MIKALFIVSKRESLRKQVDHMNISAVDVCIMAWTLCSTQKVEGSILVVVGKLEWDCSRAQVTGVDLSTAYPEGQSCAGRSRI